MRLLNTTTLALHEFFGVDIPPYAILSHRWEGREVTFQDLQSEPRPASPSFSKVTKCCAQAVSNGIEWAWIDTCCIDKTSSAELSEAINSMFRWYREAQICYAYLFDVPDGGDWETRQKGDSAFRKSQWFARGWTLQELLAPEMVVFFDADWEDIGTKNSMQALLSSITGIDSFKDFESACIAKKMSWASMRHTTREEDKAYCLMGLFGVNMPPLYGEGMGAFYRLQLEILKTTTDDSIFAWGDPLAHQEWDVGVLAYAPLDFSHCQHIETRRPFSEQEFAMTNKGMRMSSRLVPYNDPTFIAAYAQFLTPLSCVDVDRSEGYCSETSLAICLLKSNQDTYMRKGSVVRGIDEKIQRRIDGGKLTVFYIQRRPRKVPPNTMVPNFVFNCASSVEHGYGSGTIVGVRGPRKPSFYEQPQDRNECLRSTASRSEFWGARKNRERYIWHYEFISETRQDCFVLGLCTVAGRPGAAIALAPVDISPEAGIYRAVEEIRHLDMSERLSKLLSSGWSVSVALRLGPVNEVGRLRDCLVEVSIDTEGKLKWPS